MVLYASCRDKRQRWTLKSKQCTKYKHVNSLEYFFEFLKNKTSQSTMDKVQCLSEDKHEVMSKSYFRLEFLSRFFRRAEDINLRVWSWLRTNAGGVPNTCKSSGVLQWISFGIEAEELSGGRVSNAWAICLLQGDNTGKLVLIPHKTVLRHRKATKGAIR